MEFNFEKLRSDNYAKWETDCKLMLTAKGLLGFLDGSEKEPELGATIKTINAFKTRKEQSKALIAISVNDEYRSIVISQPDAKTAWEALAKIFEPESCIRKSRLRRQFLSLKINIGEDMACFLSRVDETATKLQQAHVTVNDEEIAYQYLDFLPDEYEHVSAQIYHWKPEDFTRQNIKEMLIMLVLLFCFYAQHALLFYCNQGSSNQST